MSNFEILEGKLSFLRSFYQLTTEPLREIMRKIEASEEPFVPNADPERYDQQPFLGEWFEAEEGLELQQQVCLTVLQRSFKEFLDGTVLQHRDYANNKPKVKNHNWFAAYKTWFLVEVAMDWDKAPVSLSTMEELTLARNCVQHGGESANIGPKTGLVKMQSDDYHARFPDGFFANEFEKLLRKGSAFPQPVRIELTSEKLAAAIEEVLAFCKYIDEYLPASFLSEKQV